MQNVTHVLKTGMSASGIQAVCSNFNWINFLRRFIFADELYNFPFYSKSINKSNKESIFIFPCLGAKNELVG